MDEQVGEILQQLDEDGLAENTIVIWTTDHGDGLPRAKREVYDSGIKVPMIIRWPEKYKPADVKPGSLDRRLISFVDLAPTILNLAGVDVPGYMRGSVFAGSEKDSEPQYIFAAKDRMIEVEDRQRAVRDKRFKYIRNFQSGTPGAEHLGFRDKLDVMQELWAFYYADKLEGAQQNWFEARLVEELYDTQKDPYEIKNLALDSNYKQELIRLRAALDGWLSNTVDQSETPEIEMAQMFWPQGEQPVTEKPEIRFSQETSTVQLIANTEGVSIGFRINGGDWHVYKQPLTVTTKDSVEAKAVRYGWLASDVVTWNH
jgi:N-sulfoglucosamine sulfohydrolase